MKSIKPYSILLFFGLVFTVLGCSTSNPINAQDKDNKKPEKERREDKERKEGITEHERDKDGNSEGEESGDEFSKTEKYDKVRKGARLILAYDAEKNAFVGTVTNVTKRKLSKVRVEVHLSNGKELGPTKRKSLRPGQTRKIKIKGSKRAFEKWSAHAEVGSNEHDNEGDRHKEGEGEGEGDGDGDN